RSAGRDAATRLRPGRLRAVFPARPFRPAATHALFPADACGTRAADPLIRRLSMQQIACAISLALCLPLTAFAGVAGDPLEPAPIQSAPIQSDAIQPDPIQPLVTLRDSGYLLGDMIDERIDLNLPPGVSLDPDSLPPPRRVAPWMEIRSSRIDRGGQEGTQSVIVRYQIFAEVEETG